MDVGAFLVHHFEPRTASGVNHLELQKKLVKTHVQRVGDFQKNFDGWRALAALNAPNIIGVDVGSFRQGFLAKTGLHPVF